LNALELTRLEKAAADCGFDLTPQTNGDGLDLRSAQFPEVLTVKPGPNESFFVDASNSILLPGTPPGQSHAAHGWQALYAALETASSIARTLPDRVAQQFAKATANMPKSTEVERLVVQRVGQQLFRDALLAFWQGRCCITGLAVPALLRASHIRPWAACESDEQRLDVFNGLLLAAHWDAAFDVGLVTFDVDGKLLPSSKLPAEALQLIAGAAAPAALSIDLKQQHSQFMQWHREHVFLRI
jgi:putative restriction endonuclease